MIGAVTMAKTMQPRDGSDVKKLSEREVNALERARQKADLIAWLRAEAAAKDGEMAWYVARIRGRADAVAAVLKAHGIEAVCPMQRTWRRPRRHGDRFPVESPLLGPYLFVRVLKAASAWMGLLTFEGVIGLQGGEDPVPLSTRDEKAVMQLIGSAMEIRLSREARIAVGNVVLHPVGTFADLHGTVLEIDESKRLALVETVLFGRPMMTRCRIDDLEKLA